MVLWGLTWASAAPALDVALGEAGWESLGERRTDVGAVQVWRRMLDDATCVRAGMVAPATAERLLEVAADIPSVPGWSTQDLVVSEVVSRNGTTFDYWQYIDVPGWLMVADRYWVVRGHTDRLSEGRVRFTWEQVAATEHGEVDDKALARSEHAIRVPVTLGAWVFEPRAEGTWATYTNCADPGGKLPDWVVRFAATRTVPDNMADLVREAKKRASRP